jgi:hypothetical protein
VLADGRGCWGGSRVTQVVGEDQPRALLLPEAGTRTN